MSLKEEKKYENEKNGLIAGACLGCLGIVGAVASFIKNSSSKIPDEIALNLTSRKEMDSIMKEMEKDNKKNRFRGYK